MYSRLNNDRNPTMYWICAIGSFILFFLDIIFEFLVMSYVHNHGYKIIHINMACILLLFLSLGAFVGVCTLYTICLSEEREQYDYVSGKLVVTCSGKLIKGPFNDV